MNNVVALPGRGWIDLDPEQIRKNLEGLFPGVPIWFGEWTGSWWGMVGDRLLEAPSPGELANRIQRALTASPRFTSFSGPVTAPPSAAAVLESRVSAARDEQRATTTARGHRAPRGHRFGRLGRMIGRAA